MTIINNKITSRQFTILVFCVTIGDLVLNLSSLIAYESRQDAWLACLLGCILGLSFVLLYSAIAKRSGRLPFFTFTERVLGRWLGIMFSLSMLLFLFLTMSGFVREVSVFMVVHMLPGTPVQVTKLMFLIVIVIAARLGIEAFTRSAELFFAAFVLLFIFLVLSLIPSFELQYYEPVLASGPKPIIRGVMQTTLLVFSELYVFLKIIPHVLNKHKVKPNFIIGAALGGLVLVILTFLCIIVLGAEATARNLYPVYFLARKINVGNFIQRMEVIFTFMWIITTFVKLTVFFYAYCAGMARVLRMKDYRTLTFPTAIMLYVIASALSPNTVYQSYVLAKYWYLFNLTFAVLLPALLLITFIIRQKIQPDLLRQMR